MMPILLALHWLNLKRDRVALVLSFVLPVVFFSLFAALFGGQASGAGETSLVAVLVADRDQTDLSRWFVTALGEVKALRVVPEQTLGPAAGTPDGVQAAIRNGTYDIAVLIPQGFSVAFTTFTPETAPLDILYNAANPMARFMIGGVLQSAALKVAPALLLQRGIARLEQQSQALPPGQREAAETLLQALRGPHPWRALGVDQAPSHEVAPQGPGPAWLPAALQYTAMVGGVVRLADVRGRQGDMVAYYAAGIGVMFLLFSMAGAGGSLLAEQEAGTLERLLNSNLTMGTLLLGKWLFFSAMACVQMLLMFVWGAVVFGLELWTLNRLAGLLAMVGVTAASAAAFGLVLATVCRSRAQLSGVSTVVILLMSVLGGSMAPRFVMPAFMQHVAAFTLNGQALDGFLKVFWYDTPQDTLLTSLLALWPHLTVLTALTCVCLALAYTLARRWETV